MTIGTLGFFVGLMLHGGVQAAPLPSVASTMVPVTRLIGQVAPYLTPVLVRGETGTGKELVAAEIHRLSPRSHRRLVVFNCAAIPDTLVESTLFGAERGAYTDAKAARHGLFFAADRSTLLLDEVGELSLVAQAKLLRVLEDGDYYRVGGTDVCHSDVRLITSTNRDLSDAVGKGTFREDLLYRLNAVEIAIPPLRQRRDDIRPLAVHFAEAFAAEYDTPPKHFAAEALRQLADGLWPGNIRQLKHVVERLCLAVDGPVITGSDLPALPNGPPNGSSLKHRVLAGRMTLPEAVEELEREIIEAAMFDANFRPTTAAARIGCNRRHLTYRIAKWQGRGHGQAA